MWGLGRPAGSFETRLLVYVRKLTVPEGTLGASICVLATQVCTTWGLQTLLLLDRREQQQLSEGHVPVLSSADF